MGGFGVGYGGMGLGFWVLGGTLKAYHGKCLRIDLSLGFRVFWCYHVLCRVRVVGTVFTALRFLGFVLRVQGVGHGRGLKRFEFKVFGSGLWVWEFS